MLFLLDTHAWLWWQSEPHRLSEACRSLFADTDQTLLFSAASSWEIAIKFALKKLTLPEPPVQFVPKRLAKAGISPLPIQQAHALRVSELPHHHGDPFDRLLIAQAQLEGATLATGDPQFLLYDVDVLWAAAGEPPSAVHESGRQLSLDGLSSLGSRKRRSPSRQPRRRKTSPPSRPPRGRKAK
jgi:PIN domain nuclease of toxin-antitoxin system